MSNDRNGLYMFGPFRLDVQEHRLERVDGVAVGPLPEKAFRTLVLLVENGGRLIGKQEILDHVWPDSYVEPNNVDKCIYAIRTALGEKSGEQRYVETVRKHGYRFVADVRKLAEGLEQTIADEPQTSILEPARKKNQSLRWLAIAFAGLIAAIAIAAVAATRYWPPAGQEQSPPVPRTIQRRLTTEGGATLAAISNDGKYAAVVQNASLVLFDLEEDKKTVLVPARPDTLILAASFKPDNSAIYFGTRQNDGTVRTLYSRPLSAQGEAVKVLDDFYGYISFTQDGRKFAFVRRYSELNQTVVMTADADGSNVRKLASSTAPNQFEGVPAWSPDDSVVAVESLSIEGGFHHTIALIDASSGEVRHVPGQRWAAFSSLSWLDDSQTLIVTAQAPQTANSQVWRVDARSGAATRVTSDELIAYESTSSSGSGRRVLAVKVRENSHVWLAGEGQEPKQLTAGLDNKDGAHGLAWLPGGGFLYHSIASGRDAIWRMDADGSGAARIVDDTEGGFAISPDGRWLVYQTKQPTDHLGLQALDLKDGSTRDITRGITANQPAFFPDGRRIVFTHYVSRLTLHETTIDGAAPKLLTDEFLRVQSPAVSPTGRLVAFAFQRAKGERTENGIAILDDATRRIISSYVVEISFLNPYEEATIGWSADESEVYFITVGANSVSNVMRLRLTDGNVSPVTKFTDGRVFNFAVEPSGKRMLLARGAVERDAVLIETAE